VIEAKSGRPRRVGDAAHSMRRNKRRALLACAVCIDRDRQPVPMELLGRVGVVVDVHHDPHALRQADKRARKLPVAGRGCKDAIGREFNESGPNADRVVRRSLGRCRLVGPRRAAQCGA
jgi:hypothetical protein